MPNWSTDIPKDSRGPSLPIKRTPTSRPLVAIVTSEDLIGCYTHFWGGHTVPCELPDCEPHRQGIPFRWHGYLSAIEHNTHLHFIFEMTAQAAEAFKDYKKANGTLRGCVFEAKRHRSVVNGRVCIRTKPADLRELHLPQGADLRKCMSIIWSLPDSTVVTSGTIKTVDRLQINPQAPPANGPSPRK